MSTVCESLNGGQIKYLFVYFPSPFYFMFLYSVCTGTASTILRQLKHSLRMPQENERVYSRARRPRNRVSISSVTRGFSLSRASITFIGPTQYIERDMLQV